MIRVALDLLEGWVIIWAFCFKTSAGVMMRHETSSAADEAKA